VHCMPPLQVPPQREGVQRAPAREHQLPVPAVAALVRSVIQLPQKPRLHRRGLERRLADAPAVEELKAARLEVAEENRLDWLAPLAPWPDEAVRKLAVPAQAACTIETSHSIMNFAKQ
jgi:hypothetical protein